MADPPVISPLKPSGAGEGKPGRAEDLSRPIADLAPVWRDCVISVGTGAGMMAFQPTDPARRVAGGWEAISGPARLHLREGARVVAFETISSDPCGWNHGIALCGAVGAMPQTDGRICELAAGGAPLFDLGGDDTVRLRFHPASGALEGMRRCLGLTFDQAAADIARIPGTWRVETECATVELDHPGGPPPIHRLGVKPARTTPLPPGWVALAHIFPPHPARMRPEQPMAFDPERHGVFQTILARHGRADLVDLKARVLDMLRAGTFRRMALDRHGVAVLRVALRQHLARTGHVPPDDWLRAYDRPLWIALQTPAMIDRTPPPT